MKTKLFPGLKAVCLALLAAGMFTLMGCNGEDNDNGGINTPPVTKDSYFTQTGPMPTVAFGDSIYLEIGYKNAAATEVAWSLNGQPTEAIPIEGGAGRYWVSTKSGRIGTNAVSATSTYPDQKKETISINIYVKSDIVPEKLNYTILQSVEHNSSFYTQGLVYEDGWVYEGTGLTGESKLACYNFQTKEFKNEISMDPEIFGEGITLFEDKIYQITYQSGKVFVYDKETFAKIRDFGWYSEGWGLTTDGKQLILSDGTSTLYFLDPNTFTESSKIEVADNYGPIMKLNELEYVDGLVWANIWQTDRIVVIDPQTGKVVKEANMAGLLPEYSSQYQQDLVLNGIAHKPDSDTFIITGKKWPKMFEVAFSISS